MPPPEPRTPGAVPEEPGCVGLDVTGGLDSDADDRADSVFTEHGDDLLLHTDLDADGLTDQTVRLRADGGTSMEVCADPPSLVEMLLRWLRLR